MSRESILVEETISIKRVFKKKDTGIDYRATLHPSGKIEKIERIGKNQNIEIPLNTDFVRNLKNDIVRIDATKNSHGGYFSEITKKKQKTKKEKKQASS